MKIKNLDNFTPSTSLNEGLSVSSYIWTKTFLDDFQNTLIDCLEELKSEGLLNLDFNSGSEVDDLNSQNTFAEGVLDKWADFSGDDIDETDAIGNLPAIFDQMEMYGVDQMDNFIAELNRDQRFKDRIKQILLNALNEVY